MSEDFKKMMFSGAQPTGNIHLGNYLGAVKNWAKIQDEYNCVLCVVDLHSITMRQDPQVLRKACRDLLMMYIACGLDPEKNIIYYQSHVSAHSELAWILNCFTYIGELNRMTQFKDKSQKHGENINAGLLTYPVLQAADILLYQTSYVAVGEDQKQHIEITRDIAERFNKIYGDVFEIPDILLGKHGSKVMGLQDPTRKMSKSEADNLNNIVYLSDDPKNIMNKIKRAVTDSGSEVIYSDDKPGIKNLLNIYMSFTGKTVAECEKEFAGMGYGGFKTAVGEVVVDEAVKIQAKFEELKNNKDYVDNIIKTNGEKANYIANRTLRKVKQKLGFPKTI